MHFDAVVVAGGGARRLGGVDKLALEVGGARVLDRVLAACADARTTVVVGPARPTTRRVGWAREDPPGGGPLAAIGAGLTALPSRGSSTVVVLAGDLPLLDVGTVRALVAAVGDAAVACLVDASGRRQPLAAAWRAPALAAAVRAVAGPGGSLHGRPARALLAAAGPVVEVGAGAAATDCDTPEDLVAVRAAAARRDHAGGSPG